MSADKRENVLAAAWTKVKQEQLMAEVGLNSDEEKRIMRDVRKASPKIIFVACETFLAFTVR